MTDEMIMRLTMDSLVTIAKISGPILLTTLIVGFSVSVFQALTQINEATLSFIPKIIVVGILIALVGPWMLQILTQFATNLFENIPQMIRLSQ